jgi:plastocyanin
MRRRAYVRGTAATVLAGAVAGCSGDGDGSSDRGENEVAVDPNGGNRFDPETLTVSVGETVTWRFERAGHNVSCVPDHHEDVSLPQGADTFASYDGDAPHETMAEGDTVSHTFEVAGEYHYVCVPHASIGMQGTIVVEE